MTGSVHYERHADVAVLKIDYPPVNALGAAVRQGLFDGVRRAAEDESRAVVLIGAGQTFPAGADIREFGKPLQGCPLAEVMEVVEACEKPFIAAMHGTVFGGGLETALACDYRVAVAAATLGLPEVKLGLLPGAGGTQRLPRLVGVEFAMRMMNEGEPIDAATALTLGILDRVVDGDLFEAALTFAREVIHESRGKRRVRDLSCDVVEEAVFAEAEARAAWRTAHQNAPGRIIQCVRAAMSDGGFDAGLARERALFDACMNDPQREAMIHMFFSERRSAKVPDVGREVAAKNIETAVVVGAGTMGRGIAMCFANAGVPVTIVDTAPGALEAATLSMEGTYSRAVRRGKMGADEAQTKQGRIRTAEGLEVASGADLVIEAVFENMKIKREIFAQLDAIAPAGAILATNTSTLDIDRIASATSRPGEVIGMHFFSPAHAMRLLEVVRGDATAPETIATAMRLGKKLGKVSVLARNCYGFIGNRMLDPYLREAAFLLEEGATPVQVDAAITSFGFAMGPFAMQDLAGLDVGWRARQERGSVEGERYSPVADRLCELGRFGQKTRRGFYQYDARSRAPIEDPEVLEIIEASAAERGVERREITDQEIIDRCVLALVGEGARILEDGIAIRAADIDVVYVHGYGFPRWRGGPMFYADQRGLAAVRDAMRELEVQHGAAWEAPPLLERLASQAGRFTG